MDQHHTVEDLGIALGEAVRSALGSKRGILRAGYFLMPMDETLARWRSISAGARTASASGNSRRAQVGDLQTELLEDFFRGIRAGGRGQRASAPALRPLVAPPGGGAVQGVRAGLRFAATRDPQMKRVLPSTKG